MKYKYGIIGNGQMATHFCHYFDLENIKYITWNRKEDSDLPEEKLKKCNIIIILISDDSIEKFINDNSNLKEKTLIHFSGVLSIPHIIGFHPLMTFSKNLYTLEKYRGVPFIGENNTSDFQTYFPTLKNPYHNIKKEQKPLYHALCVLSGNLSTILWQKTIKEFETELELPKEILFPYMDQISLNIQSDFKNALTGPIKRQDKGTMMKNKKAIKSKIWKKIYTLFNKAYLMEIK